MKRIIKVFATISLFIACNNSSENFSEQTLLSPETVEVYLLDSLNDSRGFCIDIVGSKTNADIDKGLQTHSCYSYQGQISIDQGFDRVKIDENEFYIPFFNVCMEAEKIEDLSNLNLKTCDGNEKQKFILQNDGKIQPLTNFNLCLTVSDSYREGGGGSPVHLIRNLSLQFCNDTSSSSSRQKWGVRKSK
tara:strand:- start:11423 stop:11992 length:570 start_codon:yes stop_codon:yes gene_type:complete